MSESKRRTSLKLKQQLIFFTAFSITTKSLALPLSAWGRGRSILSGFRYDQRQNSSLQMYTSISKSLLLRGGGGGGGNGGNASTEKSATGGLSDCVLLSSSSQQKNKMSSTLITTENSIRPENTNNLPRGGATGLKQIESKFSSSSNSKSSNYNVNVDKEQNASPQTKTIQSSQNNNNCILEEPICRKDDETRFSLFPIEHSDLWSMYKQRGVFEMD